MMRLYPLVRHFMVTEIARKYETLDYTYSAMDMNAYFTRLATEFDNFATSSEETVKKLKQVLRKSLASAGLLTGKHSDELVPIFLDPEVEDAMPVHAWLHPSHTLRIESIVWVNAIRQTGHIFAAGRTPGGRGWGEP